MFLLTYTSAANGTPTPTYSYLFSGSTVGSGSGTGSGSTFNKGITSVVVTATNTCGTTTCSFQITVNDIEAPVITCSSNVTVMADQGSCDAVLKITPPASSHSFPP